MKKLILFLLAILSISLATSCNLLQEIIDYDDPNKEENLEETSSLKLHHIIEDITPFESVYLAEDGNCLAIKKDTTFGFVAVIDSLKVDDKKALVVYIDSLGKVRRVFNDGKSLDISYNSDDNINLWYRECDGTSIVFNEVKYTSTKAMTKAGETFDPTDIFSIAFSLLGIKDIKDAVAYHPRIGDGLKAIIMTDLLTTGPFSNTSTEIITGVTSIAISAIVGGGGLPLTVLLAIIGTADAAISDWQNMVADSYFGTALPVTGDVVQLTDKHFVISYSVDNISPEKTNFNVGVILADGLFITKNHHLLKKSVPFSSKEGKIIVNLEDVVKKKGDKLKYRIYIESADDNGFKWDDKLLDYWRYGKVNEFVIDEPALKIENVIQTDETVNDTKSIYTFDVDVTISNEIPFELNEWGVGIYATLDDVCNSDSELYDMISSERSNKDRLSFSININHSWMNTEEYPHAPILNYFAVPYLSFDAHTYGLYGSAVKIDLVYTNDDSEEGNDGNDEGDDDDDWDDDDDHDWDDDDGDDDDWDDDEGNDDEIDPVTLEVTSGEWIDLGLSCLWRSYNLGANSPEDYGGYYGYSFVNSRATTYTTATLKQVQELMDKCTFKYGTYRNVKGCYVIGPNGNIIFLPFAGLKTDDGIQDAGSMGIYMSSTIGRYDEDGQNYWFLMCDKYCEEYGVDYGYGLPGTELSARPVCKKQ